MLGLLAKMASVELDAAGLEKSLGVLPARTRLVIQLHYGIGGEAEHTLAEIAERLSMTRERVRQIEEQGIRTISKGRTFQVTVR